LSTLNKRADAQKLYSVHHSFFPPKTRREPTITGGEATEKKSHFIKEGIVSMGERPTRGQESERTSNDERLDQMTKRLADHGDFVPTQENFEECKKRWLNNSVEPSSEQPTRRWKSERAVEGDGLDPLDGSRDGNKADENTTRISWTEEVKKLMPTE
jgi:hypothetical protein